MLVVGDHATWHKRFDAPLESDIDALAGSVSGWTRRSLRSADVAADAAEAVAAASAGLAVALATAAAIMRSISALIACGSPLRPCNTARVKITSSGAWLWR